MNSDTFSLSGKKIIITGASSGIGRMCSVVCSQRGGKVILFGRDRTRLNDTLSQMENSSGHSAISVDLRDYEKVENIIDDIISRTGKIDGLINCAGISTTLPLNMARPEKLDEFFSINVHAAINLTRIVVRRSNFSDEGGSIIFVSSVMSETGATGKTIYCLTKGALVAGSKSIAIELAPRNIRVNCVSPGVVETPMSQGAAYSRNEESLKTIRDLHPLGLGKPVDIANTCAFLLSDAARWITGTNLIVDGGYLAM